MTEQEKMEWMLRLADRVAQGNGMVNICMMGNQQNIYQANSARDAGVCGNAEKQDDADGDNLAAEQKAECIALPPELDTQDMRNMLDSLVEVGILLGKYQLKNQTWTEKSVIVAFLSAKIGKRCMWSAFAKLWGCDKNALQSAYAKRCDTAAAKAYFQKLNDILG